MTETTPTPPRCPLCGQDEFDWGDIQAHGLQFHIESATWWETNFTMGYKLRARLCRTCANIQLFAASKEAGTAAPAA